MLTRMERLPTLKAARTAKGLSQEALASAAGISASTVYRAERGGSTVTLEVLGNLADALDVTTDHLLGRDDNDRRSAADLPRCGAADPHKGA